MLLYALHVAARKIWKTDKKEDPRVAMLMFIVLFLAWAIPFVFHALWNNDHTAAALSEIAAQSSDFVSMSDNSTQLSDSGVMMLHTTYTWVNGLYYAPLIACIALASLGVEGRLVHG
ncbi:predicted protein [Postia placenta Mad-698-R]|nr:predicted protein [Postia placenta Mad-698-R]